MTDTIRNELPETGLKTSDFNYDLPKELIAQTPAEPRDSARLLALDRFTGERRHDVFRNIVNYLDPSDVLVINESRVIPARLHGKNSGHDVEVLLLRRRSETEWETLVRPGKRARIGDVVDFGGLRATVTEIVEEGNRIVRLEHDNRFGSVVEAIDAVGATPLPPYIEREPDEADRERYQTVYAKTDGSAAAPTAGLHFTPELLDRIRAMGVAIAPVTLHVGLGTFRPVKEERIGDHVMHSEFISVSAESARLINERRAAGGRIVAVGTTSCRTLESAADENGTIRPMQCDTGIFIYPGYRFRATDALITNFHLPESTLLMLVSAFANRERILAAYNEAVAMRYRFFSYGDAMFLTDLTKGGGAK
jgi:S-adenosylmethionine:tRNA ribosyltransferase-isomerase